MIERYTLKKMGGIWSEEAKFRRMLEVELAVCEAWAALGKIPAAALANIKKKADFNLARIKEIEEETKHDIIAFLTNVGEYAGPDARFIHMGMTSNDVLDTGLALQLKAASALLIDDVKQVIAALKKKTRKYKYTPMAGRTHNVHAEPITFGLKLALWHEEMKRNLARLERARETVCVGKLSGAVGTYSNIDPRVEKIALKKLGLTAEPAANQVVQRDRHAEFLSALAITGASLEKFTTEIRNLQHTEILEVEEHFAKGQKGSSAMPHKRNPITCERISGLARVLRANALAAMENVTLWHERDISHSSVERIIVPDSAIVLDYMLVLFRDLVENLIVYPENMLRNMARTKSLMFSQRVLLLLVEKGLSREEAYRIVQKNAMAAWKNGADFQALLLKDDKVRSLAGKAALKKCFDFDFALRNIDVIFKRTGL